MTRHFTFIAVAMLLAGCDGFASGTEPEPVDTPDAVQSSPPAKSAKGQVPTGGARQVAEETDTFLFEYSYPKEAGEIPGLAGWLDGKLDRQRQVLARAATRGREQASDNGFPFNKYFSGTEWQVAAKIPGWLSLSAKLDSYEGGAHPNYGFDAVVWDVENRDALEPIAFFTSPQALDEVLGGRLCEALNAERENRRGSPIDPESDEVFDQCVTPDDTNLLLGSRSGEKFDRIGIQIAPYLAGSYAEGAYEFDFDMDEALLRIVRPEYRKAFATRN